MAAIRPRTPAASRSAAPDHGRPATVTRCDERGTWLVELHGEHDLSTMPGLEQQTRHVWPHCTIAVIDLSEVTFTDSSLIAWLLRVEQALEEAQGFTLSIVTGPTGCAAGRLFERIHMDCVLACYPSRREAFMQAVAGADALTWPALSAATLGCDTAERRAA
ncbi:MAG: hypothetical protein QOH95_2011 [Gaiellaceae bacterium]|nr:hypothetical protein [Gaiellaceae bacterium]